MSNAPTGHTFIRVVDLPYLSHVPNDGRGIVVSPYYDAEGRQFYAYSLQPDNMILILKPIDYIEGTYLAKNPANERLDSYLPFSEMLIQHFSFPDVMHALRNVEKDLINGLASLHKYFVLLDYADDADRLMLSIELEYAFGNHRAFYDCLHRIIALVHRRYKPQASKLPDSFAKIAEKTEQDLTVKYQIPKPLIDFYQARKDTFMRARKVRDNIFHHGHSPELIFKLPDGFAVRVDDRLIRPLGDLNLWPEALLKPNGLGSLLAILECLTRDMFETTEHLGRAFVDCFEEPPQAMVAGHKAYLRSRVAKHLLSLDEYRARHWFDPRSVLDTTSNDLDH